MCTMQAVRTESNNTRLLEGTKAVHVYYITQMQREHR